VGLEAADWDVLAKNTLVLARINHDEPCPARHHAAAGCTPWVGVASAAAGRPSGASSPVIHRRTPSPEPVEAAFDDVAAPVGRLVEPAGTSTTARSACELVGAFGDGGLDAVPAEVGAEGAG